MLIKLLLMLAFGLKQAAAICFQNEPSNVKRKVTGRPKAVDDYHCKIMCVEKSDCLSYIFPENECFLLGKPAYDADTTCIKQYYEWVKKTNDVDCPVDIPQSNTDDEYEPNPALALATPLESVTINKLQPCPQGAYILDTILPDSSHQVHGTFWMMISWDGKLGSWILTKKTQIAGVEINTTTYIRAVKGFTYDSIDFSDDTSCGEIPPMTVPVNNQTQYESTGPAKRNAQQYADMCSSSYFMYILGYLPDRAVVFADKSHRMACIDGVWIRSTPGHTSKILNGTCVKPI